MCVRSEGRFPATNTAPGTSWGARLPESPQEGLCLLKHLKGVLVEFPLQGGAREGESAPTKLWVTTKPAEAAEPSDALSRGSRPSQRVCVLFIQAKRGYSFQPVRETLGYVTLGMKKMRLLFFFFPGEKCCEIVKKQPSVSTVTPAPQKLLYHKINSQSAGLWG